MMRIVIAPDSFKESASAPRVAEVIAAGCRKVLPEAETVLLPIADGGEGTVDAIVRATGGEIREAEVTGPIGQPVKARYGLIHNRTTAVLELASTSGLALVPPEKRDPRYTTTFGMGELIREVLGCGVRKIVIGLGGSATNDGGAGMAQALGYRLLDAKGKDLPPGGAALLGLASIARESVPDALHHLEIVAACDVSNPLCGENGASRIYAPQKGASPETVEHLEKALTRFSAVVKDQLGKEVRYVPGAGAAGGMGAGLLAFTPARLVPGFPLIAEVCGLERHIAKADLVLTGEGTLDGQTARGKTVSGVARMAARYGVPVVSFAGKLGKGYELVYEMGLTAAFSIADGPMTLSESIARLPELLEQSVISILRVWKVGSKEKS